jgi:hypothetical protein
MIVVTYSFYSDSSLLKDSFATMVQLVFEIYINLISLVKPNHNTTSNGSDQVYTRKGFNTGFREL